MKHGCCTGRHMSPLDMKTETIGTPVATVQILKFSVQEPGGKSGREGTEQGVDVLQYKRSMLGKYGWHRGYCIPNSRFAAYSPQKIPETSSLRYPSRKRAQKRADISLIKRSSFERKSLTVHDGSSICRANEDSPDPVRSVHSARAMRSIRNGRQSKTQESATCVHSSEHTRQEQTKSAHETRDGQVPRFLFQNSYVLNLEAVYRIVAGRSPSVHTKNSRHQTRCTGARIRELRAQGQVHCALTPASSNLYIMARRTLQQLPQGL